MAGQLKVGVDDVAKSGIYLLHSRSGRRGQVRYISTAQSEWTTWPSQVYIYCKVGVDDVAKSGIYLLHSRSGRRGQVRYISTAQSEWTTWPSQVFLVHRTRKSDRKCSARFFCLVLPVWYRTSGVLVLCLFAGHGYEKNNLLPVVWPRQIYLSLGWSVVTSQSRLKPRLGFVTTDHPRLR